ncbi:MAG: ABC transporter ATP-binding protein [Alphaproteobacteria bacterium]
MSDVTLSVRGLEAGFTMGGRTVMVVREVDLDVRKGEMVGIIGESGSGKTVTGMSILRLLPENAVTRAERVDFLGTDLLDLSADAFRELRGRRIAMVFQDPVGAFNPAKKIEWHLKEIFERSASKSTAHAERAKNWRGAAIDLLKDVGIPHGANVLHLFPHQLSGGMLQRTLIAMVLAFEPDLIVADEPTTNLDNIVERQILRLFRDLQKRLDCAFLFITHDMSIAHMLCDRIAVMYAGRIVETGPTKQVFAEPKHPYTQGLLASALALDTKTARLKEIPGELPSPTELPPGCLFEPRCASAKPQCRAALPAMSDLGGGRNVRCVLYDHA